ncbi:hypothetical protein V7S43_002634 [Phytophthora oleae]|uniref:Uncharacterized protein n=1 Tax=Phytophthora oleae TaxID=2107226 RepID=A0ABD3G0I0_9STRA
MSCDWVKFGPIRCPDAVEVVLCTKQPQRRGLKGPFGWQKPAVWRPCALAIGSRHRAKRHAATRQRTQSQFSWFLVIHAMRRTGLALLATTMRARLPTSEHTATAFAAGALARLNGAVSELLAVPASSSSPTTGVKPYRLPIALDPRRTRPAVTGKVLRQQHTPSRDR